MGAYSLAFSPHLPVPMLAALALVAVLLVAYGIVGRARGVGLRALLLALLLTALANPLLRREERQPLPDIALLLVDRSPSQLLAGRSEQLEEASMALRTRLRALPGLEVRELSVDGATGGTRLAERLNGALQELDRDRLAGVLALTDGRVHGLPEAGAGSPAPLGAPLHVLLTGRPDEVDRRLVVEGAPSFAVVGEPVLLRLRVDDPGNSAPVPVVVRQGDKVIASTAASDGQAIELSVTLDQPGPTTYEIVADARPGELTGLNNRAVVTVNGVRERLRVLLVSGQPYPGLRVWRNLLKADPAVDLVHFTILRPPEKQDGTPIRELALIAFPSRELFEVKLADFDLVVFDRYNRRGLLPLAYLDNIARYVEAGGALLEAAGPEFASPTSLYRSPLARVLPGRPSGQVVERPFLPVVSERGRRHPVTAGLSGAEGEAPWGRWYRQIDVDPGDAEVLMTGAGDRPLLLLRRQGEGRVAQILSDNAWLWARGLEGGGPQAALLRRLVHWLMKEPQLEEERLSVQAADDGLAIERRSLQDLPVEVTVTAPSGAERKLTLTPAADGIGRARVDAPEDGLWRVSDGTRVAFAQPRPIDPVELADLRATDVTLRPMAEQSGGDVRWLGNGLPDLRRVAADRRKAGRGWLGLQRNARFTVSGSRDQALLPPWLALLLLLTAAGTTWWREGRG